MSNKKTRVLYICPGGFGLGGVQATIMYLARTLPKDEVQIDVVVFSETRGYYEEEFLQYGSIYRIPAKKATSKLEKIIQPYTNQWIIYQGVRKIIREHGPYDTIHAAYLFMSGACVAAAKKEGVPIRVSHSRVNEPINKEKLYIKLYNDLHNAICRSLINCSSTVRLGVTKDSLHYLFGNAKNMHVIRNPILDTEKFSVDIYDVTPRKHIQLIQVGNFSHRKNPLFTVNVLHEMEKRWQDNEVRLTLLGQDNHEGQPYARRLTEQIHKYGLEEKVKFLPANANVANAMANADIMMIPSLQEGLPNVALEAQAMGLPCFLSATVSAETDYGLCHFLELEKGAAFWAEEICAYLRKYGTKKRFVDMSAYDIKKVCREHLDIWRGEKYGHDE